MRAAALHRRTLCVRVLVFVGSFFGFIGRVASTASRFFMLFQHEFLHVVIVLADHRFGECDRLLATAASRCTRTGFTCVCYAVHLNITFGAWITGRAAAAAFFEALLPWTENATWLTSGGIGVIAFNFHGFIGADGRGFAAEKPTQVLVVIQLIVCWRRFRWTFTVVIVVMWRYFAQHHRTTIRCCQLGFGRQIQFQVLLMRHMSNRRFQEGRKCLTALWDLLFNGNRWPRYRFGQQFYYIFLQALSIRPQILSRFAREYVAMLWTWNESDRKWRYIMIMRSWIVGINASYLAKHDGCRWRIPTCATTDSRNWSILFRGWRSIRYWSKIGTADCRTMTRRFALSSWPFRRLLSKIPNLLDDKSPLFVCRLYLAANSQMPKPMNRRCGPEYR